MKYIFQDGSHISKQKSDALIPVILCVKHIYNNKEQRKH